MKCIYPNVLLLLAVLVPLKGANIVWEDTGTDWGTGANWVGDVAPTNDITTDVAVFSDATPSFQPNLGSAFSVNGIHFTSGGWTLSGSDLTVGTGGVDSNGGLSNTINLDLTDASTSQYVLGAGSTLTFNGAFNSTGNHTFGTSGSHTGSIILNGNQTMSGNKTLNWGTLTFNGGTTTGTGNFRIGDSSTATDGVMNILSGASVTGFDTYIGDEGTGLLTMSSGSDLILSDVFNVGGGSGGDANTSGTVNADGSGTTISAVSINIGRNLGTGTTNLTNGATMTASGNLVLGSAGSGIGYLNVDGASSQAQGDNIYIGNSATGNLTVTNGGNITSTTQTRVGSGGTGTLTVSGSGSQHVSSGTLWVGFSSTGEAHFSDNASTTSHGLVVGGLATGNGTFNLSSGADIITTNDLTIGSNGSSNGILNASGSGTTMTVTRFTYVGKSGTGTLNITDGATLTGSNQLRVGHDAAGSSGTLNIAGTGSQLQVTSGMRIGYIANSTATVSNNGVLSGTTLLLGNDANNSTGVLNIRTGGTVTTSSTVTVEEAGSYIDLEGGTLNSTGAITINAGTALNGYGTINQNITNNGSMNIDGAMTYSNVISGTGTVTKSNAGTLVLSGANTYTGQTSITGGTIQIGASGVLSDSSDVAISNGGTLGFSGSFNEVIGDLSVGSGGGAISFDGNSELLFNNDGTFSDILVIQNWDSANDKFGIIDSSLAAANKIKFMGFGGAATVAGSTSSIAGGTGYLITATSTFVQWDGGTNTNPDWNFNSGENWVGDVLPASGDTLNIEFTGTTNLSPEMTSSYTANTLMFASGSGAFTLGDNGGSEVLTLAGILPSIVVDSTNNQTINHAIQLGDGTNPNGSLVIGGSGSGSLTIAGNLSDPSGTYGIKKVGSNELILGGTNTFTGDLSLQEGTVSVSADANLGATTGTTSFDGGILKTNSSFTMNSSRSLEVNQAGGGLNIASGTTLTYGGVITGTAEFDLVGSGTFILTGNSTHTGDLKISSGELQLTTGTVDSKIIVDGGSFYGGTTANAIANAVEVKSGTVSAATDTTAGNMLITGSQTSYLAGGTFIWNLSGLTDSGSDSDGNGINEVTGTFGTHWDALSFSGALSFADASANSLIMKFRNIGSSGLTWGSDYKEFKIIEATGGIVGFNESYFQMDTTEWTDGGGWWLDFNVVQKGNALWLQYNAVPEPGTWVGIGCVSAILALGITRKIRKKHKTKMSV